MIMPCINILGERLKTFGVHHASTKFNLIMLYSRVVTPGNTYMVTQKTA